MASVDEYLVLGIFLLGASVGWLLCHVQFRGLISAWRRDLDTLSMECNGPDASPVIRLISSRHKHTDLPQPATPQESAEAVSVL